MRLVELVVMGIGILVEGRHDDTRRGEPGIEVPMPIGAIASGDPREPDHLADPEQSIQLLLDVLCAPPGVAIVVQDATAGDDRRALAVHLQRPAFEDEFGAQSAHLRTLQHLTRDQGVRIVLLLSSPSIEIEVHADELRTAHDKYRSGVAHPQIVDVHLDDADALTGEACGERDLRGPGEQAHGFEARDRVGHVGQIALHLRHQVRAPDLLGGPKAIQVRVCGALSSGISQADVASGDEDGPA